MHYLSSSKSINIKNKSLNKSLTTKSNDSFTRTFKKFRNSNFNPQDQHMKNTSKTLSSHQIKTSNSFLEKIDKKNDKIFNKQKLNQLASTKNIKIERQMSLPNNLKTPDKIKVNQNKIISISQRYKKQKQTSAEKFSKALKYIIQSNKDYLRQKTWLRYQKAKPLQKSIKIQRSKLASVYQTSFSKKKLIDSIDFNLNPIQRKKSTFQFPSRKVTGFQSISNQIHNGVQQKKTQIATWDQSWKLSGPLYTPTTYKNNYPNHGDFQKVIPFPSGRETGLGLKFNGNSSYKKDFISIQSSPSKLAKWNNLRPIGINLKNTVESTYKSMHGKQQILKDNWRPTQHRIVEAYGIYNSEYNNEFKNKINLPTNSLNHWQH